MLANLPDRVNVSVLQHKGTGLLVGCSNDLKGLYISARSLDELWQEAPKVIQTLLEAYGDQIEAVDRVDLEHPAWAAWGATFVVRRAMAVGNLV